MTKSVSLNLTGVIILGNLSSFSSFCAIHFLQQQFLLLLPLLSYVEIPLYVYLFIYFAREMQIDVQMY